jgi:hypothetical protein
VEAVRCATDIQSALRTRNDQLPASRQVKFRIGINLGDVMLHGQDLLGDGVNVAARLQTAAEPGGICISGSVHDQISNKLSLSFQPLGEMNFKNIQQPIRTFSITEAAGGGTLPSTRSRGISSAAKWIAAGIVLLLVGGGYWAYTVSQRSKTQQTPVIATSAPSEAVVPPVKPAASSGRDDGVYSGQICYGQTKNEPRRCYQAVGSITGDKIASQWTMGRENKVNMHLAGDVSKSGDIRIEIEMKSVTDGSRLATIDLTGTVHDGVIDASGSFRKGRPATLNWRKNLDASH